MKHLTDEQLSARLDGELPAKQAAAVERHLGECAACRERLAALAGADASLARALERDPGEAYFGSFADRVQARIASGAAAGAGGAPADAPPARTGWFSRPATLAWAGATASLVLVGVFAIRTALQEPAGSRLAEQRPPVAGADRLEPRAAAPKPARALEAESAPMAAAPAPGAAEDRTTAGARQGAATSEGAAAQDAASRRALAPPQRVQELQTLPNGEQVPVGTRALPGAEQRRSFAVPPADASKIRKPVALPMAPKEQAKQVVVTQEETAASAGRADESKLGLATPAPAPQSATAPAPPEAGNFAKDEARGIALQRLCGAVRNAQGRALEGATVTLVESGRSVQSGPGGAFCVDLPPEGGTLSVLALGYEERRTRVSVQDAAAPVAVTLRAVETVGREGAPVARFKTGSPPLAAAESSRAGTPSWGRTLSFFRGPGESLTSIPPPAPAPTPETARAATEAARLAKRAPLWAKAGEMWSAVAAAAKSDVEAEEARWQAADARMSAWRLAPTGRNRIEALGALNDYLSKAPAGARRDAAEGWKRELPSR